MLFLSSFIIMSCQQVNFVKINDQLPNIVIIYTDDLGYGDISYNGAVGVKTPNIDRLAKQGLNFSDAHCSAATCTPSRVALLTGQYAFRSQARILKGDAPLIIRPGTMTMPSLLKQAGYTTAVVGKWHLGLGNGSVDWNKDVKPGPLEIGFDYSFLIPATGDRTPCVYLENYRVVDHDDSDPIEVNYKNRIDKNPIGSEKRSELKQDYSRGHNMTIVNGISRIGYMIGGHKARWVDEDMADVITVNALNFIEKNKSKPFFLYFSTHDIHVPRVPHSRFVGKSSMGPRGDAIVQMDWCTGQILDKLDELDLSDNTLVIFSSDNGPVLDDGYKDFANEKIGQHKPSGPYKAGKYSFFEGGTRVPFIVRWPGKVKAGSRSSALMGQIDLCATIAHIAGITVKKEDCVDSRNAIDTLTGKNAVGRPHLIHECRGNLALRQGPWKYIPKGKSRIELGPWKEEVIVGEGAIFNLNNDILENSNLSSQQQKKLNEMKALIEKIRISGDN